MHAQAFTYGFPGRILDQPATKYRWEVVVLIQVVRKADRLLPTLDQEWQFHLDIADSTAFAPRWQVGPRHNRVDIAERSPVLTRL